MPGGVLEDSMLLTSPFLRLGLELGVWSLMHGASEVLVRSPSLLELWSFQSYWIGCGCLHPPRNHQKWFVLCLTLGCPPLVQGKIGQVGIHKSPRPLVESWGQGPYPWSFLPRKLPQSPSWIPWRKDSCLCPEVVGIQGKGPLLLEVLPSLAIHQVSVGSVTWPLTEPLPWVSWGTPSLGLGGIELDLQVDPDGMVGQVQCCVDLQWWSSMRPVSPVVVWEGEWKTGVSCSPSG